MGICHFCWRKIGGSWSCLRFPRARRSPFTASVTRALPASPRLLPTASSRWSKFSRQVTGTLLFGLSQWHEEMLWNPNSVLLLIAPLNAPFDCFPPVILLSREKWPDPVIPFFCVSIDLLWLLNAETLWLRSVSVSPEGDCRENLRWKRLLSDHDHRKWEVFMVSQKSVMFARQFKCLCACGRYVYWFITMEFLLQAPKAYQPIMISY